MCEIMQEPNKLAVERSKALHRWETQRENVFRMLKKGYNKNSIMDALGITEEEFEEISQLLAS